MEIFGERIIKAYVNKFTERFEFMKSFYFSGVSHGFRVNAQTAPTETALDRFLRYVKIDTQSQEDQTTTPSTRKQLNLANLLAKELTTLGARTCASVSLESFTLRCPGNLPDNSKVPVDRFHRTHGHVAGSLR